MFCCAFYYSTSQSKTKSKKKRKERERKDHDSLESPRLYFYMPSHSSSHYSFLYHVHDYEEFLLKEISGSELVLVGQLCVTDSRHVSFALAGLYLNEITEPSV